MCNLPLRSGTKEAIARTANAEQWAKIICLSLVVVLIAYLLH